MKDIESNTTGIFQTPVYTTELRKKFSKKELDFIINHDKDSRAKIGLNPKSTLLAKRNFGSENKHVLDQKQFKNLKKELELILQDYFDKIICPANDIVPYITNEGDKMRISLSFNTFIKGTVGLMNSATGLILK